MRKTITVLPLFIALFFLEALTPRLAIAQSVFVENKGQWPGQVSHQVKVNGGAMFMEEEGFRFVLYNTDDLERLSGHRHKKSHSAKEAENALTDTLRGHSWALRFLNTASYGYQKGKTLLPGKQNYLIGNDPAKWGRNASRFGEVMWHSMYKGIDMEVGSSEDGHLKWNFHVAPHANPEDIRFVYDHAETRLKDGKLFIETSVGEFYEYIPLAYQEIKGKRVLVKCNYTKQEGHFGFVFPNGYDPRHELVIDPVLSFASYSGSTGDNFGFTATYDNEGHLYAGSIALEPDYPTTPGAFQQTSGDTSFITGDGLVDIAITKFSKDGDTLVYSTYLGGSGTETPNSLVVNQRNELYILGMTSSTNFPLSNSAFQSDFHGGGLTVFSHNGTAFLTGSDLYITCLDSTGSNLIGSTYLGGSGNDGLNNGSGFTINNALAYNYGDIFRGEIVVDSQSNVFIASCTQSFDFPISPNAYQPDTGGSQDAIVASLSPDLSALRWSTYLGGSDHDAAYSMKLNALGDAVITGGTLSSNFPVTDTAQQNNPPGIMDGFISIINGDLGILKASIYVGTSAKDQNYFVEIDEDGQIYVVGTTEGQITASPNVYSNPNSGQYIAQYSPDLQNQNWITTFGEGDGSPELSPTAFLVDSCFNIYVSGWGGRTNAHTNHPDTFMSGLPITADAFQKTTDSSDFYFFIVGPNASTLLYATYFGGGISHEHVDGGTSRFDKAGIIYQAVCAGCYDTETGMPHSDFPTTPGAWSSTNNSYNCNLGVAKIEFNLLDFDVKAETGSDSVGCVPLTVSFVNNSTPGLSYRWDFGDGNTSSTPSPNHTYTQSGTYEVELRVFDSTTYCLIQDRTYLTIQAFDSAVAAFTYEPIYPSFGESIQFLNQSQAATQFTWDFGDGNTSTEAEPVHSYPEPGEYIVCLKVEGNLGCNDSICKRLIIPTIGLPNAFSPNGDTHNDVLYVRGLGIQEVLLKIYNRWGELVFETNDPAIGWDGTYKGVPQEQEVYVYYLDAILESGEVVQEKGNVTLIR